MITGASRGIGTEKPLHAARKRFETCINYTRDLEQAELFASQGILANTILPGIVDVETHANGGQPNWFAERGALIPMGRGGNPDEVANAVMSLLDENNTFTNGACIPVSGGI
jgi:NAD(P)-dependent dehydrogenase (short-subunit alcohol dehydrogenase family)